MGGFSLRDLGYRISLAGARDYLVRHGWQLSEEQDRIVCAGPPDDDGQPIVCVLPPSESYGDFRLRLEDLIATLGVLEDRPAVEVAAEMSRGGGRAPSSAGSWADQLTDEYFVDRGLQIAPGRDVEESLNELRTLLRRVELGVFDYFGQPLPTVALMAVRLAGTVTGGVASGLFLCEVCSRALAVGGLELQFTRSEVEDFFRIAASDDPNAPDRVLEWLSARTRPVTRTNEPNTKAPAAEQPASDQIKSRGLAE